MRILHVISSCDPRIGGPIEGVRQLGTVLRSKGHELTLATLDSPASPCVTDAPFPVHALGPGHTHYKYSHRLVPALRRLVKQHDVVVINGIWQYHSFGAWRALRRTGVPYIVFTHGMLDPYFKQRYPLKHAKKWLFWPWGDYRVLRDAAAVLFTCEEERRLASKSFWLYRAQEHVVNYGTAGPSGDSVVQRQTFLDRFPELKGKKIALFISRIHPKKGCDLLIEAFGAELGNLRDWHLVIAGPDQVGLKSQLEARAERLGVADRICWTGMLKGDIKWGALSAAEVFVLPSHQENFGIVVAEALACGTPALISDKVNIWRDVVESEAGFASSDTVEGTRELFRRWVQAPEVEKSAMRVKARACFADRFEIGAAGQSLLDILRRVSENRQREDAAHA